MSWRPVAPSPARSILPLVPQHGDRIGVWFGTLDGNDRMAIDALRWFAVREGAAFYLHHDSPGITTALVRMPDQNSWTADGGEE